MVNTTVQVADSSERRVVLMIADGLRPDALALMPGLSAALRLGTWFEAHEAVFPSVTLANACSIVTGCLPARHGIDGNVLLVEENGERRRLRPGRHGARERLAAIRGGSALLRPTLSALTAPLGTPVVMSDSVPAGVTGASVGPIQLLDTNRHGFTFHPLGCFGPGGGALQNHRFLAGVDPARTSDLADAFARRVVVDPEVPFALLWLSEPDFASHRFPLGSPPWRAALAGADAVIATVAEAVAPAVERGDVLLLICSDHGMETVRDRHSLDAALRNAGFAPEIDAGAACLLPNGSSASIAVDALDERRRAAMTDALHCLPWVAKVLEPAEMIALGAAAPDSARIGLLCRKHPGDSGFGFPGVTDTVEDFPAPGSDYTNFGNHGGLGLYERRATLLAAGEGFMPAGRSATPTSVVDIAPTALAHLGLPGGSFDGKPLQGLADLA